MRFCLAYALYPGISSMQTEEVTKNGTLKWKLAYYIRAILNFNQPG